MTAIYRCDLEDARRLTIYKFENISGSQSVEFPRDTPLFDYTGRQPIRNSYQRVTGADYQFDNYRVGNAPVDNATETVRFVMREQYISQINRRIRELRSDLRLIGLGRLWRIENMDRVAWCYARAREVYDFNWTDDHRIWVPVTVSFDRQSDWFSDVSIVSSQNVTASGQTWTVTNHGDIRSRLMTVRLRANTSAGFANPIVENLTNSYSLKSHRGAISSNSEIRYDTDRKAVEWSNDNGATYTDDFVNYIVPLVFSPLAFVLEPGANTIRYTGTGTPNLVVEFSARAAYG